MLGSNFVMPINSSVASILLHSHYRLRLLMLLQAAQLSCRRMVAWVVLLVTLMLLRIQTLELNLILEYHWCCCSCSHLDATCWNKRISRFRCTQGCHIIQALKGALCFIQQCSNLSILHFVLAAFYCCSLHTVVKRSCLCNGVGDPVITSAVLLFLPLGKHMLLN